MSNKLLIFTIAVAVVSPVAVAQNELEPMTVWAVHQDASYYDGREIAVGGHVVDSHTEWYSDSDGDYMTWNLVIGDEWYPDESADVLLCYESGFNIQRIRECSEIANVQKDLGRQVTVVGEYDRSRDILNLRKFLFFEDGEPRELDTDVGDHERVRVYTYYDRDFDYDIHYVVWYRHSYLWPHPIWWIWWEPLYVVRPPTHYVVYYTPWRTYRHRAYPVRVAPVRRVGPPGRHDNAIRVDPRDSRRSARGAPRSTAPRASTGRIRVPPTSRVPSGGSETPQVGANRERLVPRTRTGSTERVRTNREAPRPSATPRAVPSEAPPRVRTSPPVRSDSPPPAPSHEPVRVAPQRSSPSRVRPQSFAPRSTSRHVRAEAPATVRTSSPVRYSAPSRISSHQPARSAPQASSPSRVRSVGMRRR